MTLGDRGFSSREERALYEKQVAYGWPNSQPNSVYIACVGQMWATGSWEAVTKMMEATQEAGFNCWRQETSDPKIHIPYTDIESMRDSGAVEAMRLGFDYLCWIDNDIHPEPDLLLRLMASEKPVIVPFINGPANISSPKYIFGQGVQPIKWAVLSMLLIKTTVLNCLGPVPTTGLTGEGDFFRRLAYYGHQAWMDTDSVLEASSPSVIAGRTWDKYWEDMESAWNRRLQPADRGDHVEQNGRRDTSGSLQKPNGPDR